MSKGGLQAGAAARIELFTDPRQLRALWLRQLSQAVDSHMRSTAFLHWLWCTLAAKAAVQSFQSNSLGLLSAWARHSALAATTARGDSASPTPPAEAPPTT